VNHDSANLILNELYESDQENFSNNRTKIKTVFLVL